MSAPLMHPSMTRSVKRVEQFHQMISDDLAASNPIEVWAAVPEASVAASRVILYGNRAGVPSQTMKMVNTVMTFIDAEDHKLSSAVHSLILMDGDPAQ